MSQATARVLYLSYDGLTDPLGQSQVLPYILGLCRRGYAFTIVSFEKPERFAADEDTIRKLIADYPVTWKPLPYTKNPPVLSTLLDVRKLSKTCRQIIREQPHHIVHCRSYITALVGLQLQKQGLKLLFDMRGFWADERVDGGVWNLSNPLYRTIYNYFKKKEVLYNEKADHIISLTHAGKDEILSKRLFRYPAKDIRPEKISVIPCAADLDHFDPKNISDEQVQAFRRKLQLKDGEKTMMYLGSVGTWYMLPEMLHFYKRWQAQHPDYHMVYITRDQPAEIREMAESMGIAQERLHVLPAGREEVPVWLKMADIGLFFIKPVFSKKASSATKMGEMLAMELPVITNPGVGDTDLLIAKYECGMLTEPKADGPVRDFAFPDHKALRHAAEDYFSLTKGIDTYEQVYKKVL